MSRSAKHGFTLVELLVVIGIIVLLAGILLPALNKAREEAKRVQCLSNLRQLTMAWLGYANDNNGRICSSETQAFALTEKGDGLNNWTYKFANGAGLTVTTAYAGFKKQPDCFFSWIGGNGGGLSVQVGVLWNYLGDARVYLCPDDLTPAKPTSYQMNGLLAGRIGTPKTFLTLGEIHKPSGTFVFIEGWDGIGLQWKPVRDGTNLWSVMLPLNSFQTPISPEKAFKVGGIPGQNHHGASTPATGTGIAFADGHAIFWQYSDTRTGSIGEAFYGGMNNNTQNIFNPFSHQWEQTTTVDHATPNSPDVFQLETWSGGPIPLGWTQ